MILNNKLLGERMEYQLCFKSFSSAYEEFADAENEFVNYFANIELQNIRPVIDQRYGDAGPRGYGLSIILSRILKVKELLFSDRILAKRLKSNATYRAVCLMEKGHTPSHNTYNTLRSRLGVEGFRDIHRNFVYQAHSIGLLDPKLPFLPKNRRKGIILVADSTFIVANCSSKGKKLADGSWLFTDPSVSFGRPHHRYRYPVGHKAHTLISITGIPLVSILTSAAVHDQNVIFSLLKELFKKYPDLPFAYIIIDRGYDAEEIHDGIYEQFQIIPIIFRKKMVYPNSFTKSGFPLCPFGYAMQKKSIDYKRKRTKYCCQKMCLKTPKAQPDLFDCSTVHSPHPYGMVKYTHFKDSYRKYGPALPNSIMYRRLKSFRTAIEREYGLIKDNRYRMEYTNTYKGADNVLMHVIEHDITLTHDIIYHFKKQESKSPVLKI